MAKDDRLYGKFTLNFPNHPKILILSDAAFRCLVEATLYSRDQQTDGFLARRLAVAKWSLDVLQELSSNHPVSPSLIEREEGWYIHDYDEHQETKAEIEARRERNRIAGQKGGLARAKRGAKRVAKQPASEVPSETQAEEEKGAVEILGSNNTLAVGSEPPLRCKVHMNHSAPPPCGRCASAREAHEAWEADDLRQRRAAKEALAQRRRECPFCDEWGHVEVIDEHGNEAVQDCNACSQEAVNS